MEDQGIIADLLAFLDTLPAGFGCGPREQMAVRELVLRLIDGGKAPAEAAGWKTLIAPLVCGDPGQQQEFYDRFADWIGRNAPRVQPPPVEPPRRYWPAAAAACLVVSALLGGGAYYRSLFRPIPDIAMPVPPAYVPPNPDGEIRFDRLRGVVRTADGLPVRKATVWVPFGLDSPQYPKVLTNDLGEFTVDLPGRGGTLGVMTAVPLLVIPQYAVSVSFSPDGSRLATGGGNDAFVRETPSGKLVLTLHGHTDAVKSVAFSHDGRRLATASDDTTAVIWDATTGRDLLTIRCHTRVLSAAFSPDGRTLATCGEDKTAKFWDASSGREIRTLSGHTSTVKQVAFSPDGRTLATASFDGTAKIWDLATGRELFTLVDRAVQVYGVAFGLDGRFLATANSDGTARIWDAGNGGEVSTLRGHAGPVYGVAFGPDGRTLATAGYDKTAKIWDASTGKEILTIRGHTNQLNAVAFAPNGRILATAGVDNTVRLWSLSTTQPASTSNNSTPPSAGINLLVTHADYEPAYVEQAVPGPTRIVKLGPPKTAQQVWAYSPPPPPQPHRRYPLWVSIAIALIPMCAAILAFLRQRRRDRQRKAFLDQWETELDFEPVRVHTRSEEDELFQGVEVAALARELRRRRPEPTSQLAVEATVRNTAARAGLFTPVRRLRHGAREYLVLLESKGGRDQQASFWGCLFDRLSGREVWLDRYRFSGDPRICEVPGTDRGWMRLEEISALHPRHELWVVAGASRFFDPASRKPAAWVPALARWSDRAVLTLSGGTLEDREQLARLGFTVGSASVAGLAELSSEPGSQPQPAMPAPYPLILEEDESRWLQGPAPAGEEGARELRSLDRQLRAWLGGDGYRCLLACAVYPGLAWNLTLHLAVSLMPEGDRESTLARLVRLPWFRHGRMPQWLRAFFTEKLDGEASRRVTGLLKDFLERKAAQSGGSRTGLEFAKIAPELRAEKKPATRDYVFLSFLLGRKPDLRDLEAPAWLRHLLYPDGLPVLRLRRELWLAAGLLAGLLVYGGAELYANPRPPEMKPTWHRVTAPVERPAKPVNNLSARALEIAEAHLGLAYDEKFASDIFNRAVEFAVPRGTPRTGPVQPGVLFTPTSAANPSALVERVTESGLVMLEVADGGVRRVFRTGNQLAGSFSEITEGVKINAKDGLTYVWIPPGRFQMGCSRGDAECGLDESPAHQVTITKGFWMGQTPVTQEAYQRVIGTNPSYFHGGQLPVETVNWNEAQGYCQAAGGGMRLPTEAEWEYAARGGPGITGSRYGGLDQIAWYSANSGNTTHPVGQKQANALGLYDMLGNVWEWVSDWYADKYADGPQRDPTGPASGQSRTLRGGSWFDVARFARASNRYSYEPEYRNYNVGLRCAGN